MELKPYPKYKDSGIEWLEEIPGEWEIKKLKYLLKSLESGSRESQEQEFNDVDKIPSIGGEHISWSGNIEFTDNKFISKKYFLRLKKGKIKTGDVLLVKDGATIGKTAFVNNEINAAINEHVFILRTSNNFKDSLLYYNIVSDLTQDLINLFSRGAAQAGLPSDFVSNIFLLIPPEPEQTVIANFLDQKTSKIDELIKKNEKLVEILKEKRQAIISHAVIKGLDPKARMKDSGIEWIGKIPEGWKIIPLKHVAYMKGRIGWQGLKQSEFTDEGPYLITGMNFKDGVIRWEEVYHITEERYNEDPAIHLKIEDVLMTKDGTIGKLLYVDFLPGRASLNSHLLVIRPLKNHFLSKYLFYLLHSEYFKTHIEVYKTGTTFFGITQESVGKYKMLLPPIKEQKNIVTFIDKETAKIEGIILKIQSQILKLKEYRQALISNVVTGKVRV